jgi:hypothetical protein
MQKELRVDEKLTLWLSEVTLGDTILDGLVEVSIKGGWRRDGDLIVGLNVFLE